MQVNVLLNIGTNAGQLNPPIPPMSEGVHDLPKELALRMIEKGWAEPIEELEKRQAKLQAIPGKPALTAEQLEQQQQADELNKKALEREDQEARKSVAKEGSVEKATDDVKSYQDKAKHGGK